MSDIGGLLIGIGALGVFWNLMLLMAALSMMDIFPDAKKEARNCWTCGNADCRLESLPRSFGLFDCPKWEDTDD